MILEKEQKDAISKLIESVEKKSEAELVAIIAKKSGDYKNLWLYISLGLTFFISIFMMFFRLYDNTLFFIIQISSLSFFYLFFSIFEEKLIFFLPKYFKYQKASHFAHELFFTMGIHRIKSRAGILFFVSAKEQYVEIITDEKVDSTIDNSYWENIVEKFIISVKKGEFSKGYKDAIEECSHILAQKLPIKDDDENEFTNEVIEIQ